MRLISRGDLTVPNTLTVIRILMAAWAARLFMAGGAGELATMLCIIASILDYFDGWYARKFRQFTKLGAHLDPFADKVLIAVIFISISLTLRWMWFSLFVGVMLFREIVITIYRFSVRRKSGTFVPASRLGKIKTTMQCLVGNSILFYIHIYPGHLPHEGWLIFSAMMITLFITVDSGLRYILPSCSDGKKRSVIERLLQWIFGIRAREV